MPSATTTPRLVRRTPEGPPALTTYGTGKSPERQAALEHATHPWFARSESCGQSGDPTPAMHPRTNAAWHGPHLEAIRRQLAVRTRRLTDTGALTPAPPATRSQANEADSPARPVVQMLLCRYLAEHAVEHIRCVAQTRHRHRCPHPVLATTGPAGTWRLLPTGPRRGPARCPDGHLRPGPPPLQRATALARPALPSTRRRPGRRRSRPGGMAALRPSPARGTHPHPPAPPSGPPPQKPVTMPHHALEFALTRPLTPAELRHAAQAWPLAANHDTTRLMALTGAKTPNGPPTACASASPPGCPST